VHITFALIWRASRFSDDESVHPLIQDHGRKILVAQFEEIEGLVGDSWLVGDRFTAADSYALTFFRWGRRIGMDMRGYPKWAALNARLLAEPSVQRAIAGEGLELELFQPAD
jgi:glutathione S-transferase